jgi:hypothetical protein
MSFGIGSYFALATSLCEAFGEELFCSLQLLALREENQIRGKMKNLFRLRRLLCEA